MIIEPNSRNVLGRFIAVGSLKHGQGITSLVYSLGYKMSSLLDKSILIIDTNFLFNDMGYLGTTKNENSIDDLISMAKTQEITKEIFMIHTEEITHNLRMINSSQIDSMDYIKKNAEYVMKIINLARTFFDIVIVDTTAGSQNEVSKLIYSNCDVFINVMTQNPYILEWYKTHGKVANEVKELNVINLYEEIYPDTLQIKKDFEIEGLSLRYSKPLRNSYYQRKMAPFFNSKDLYNEDVKDLIKKVCDRLDIKVDLKQSTDSEPTKSGFFGFGKRK